MDPDQTLCPDVGAWIDELMLGRMMAQGHRAMGVEFERLLLHRKTRESAPLEVSRSFVQRVRRRVDGRPMIDGTVEKGFEGDAFGMSLEPGGQVELATPPARDLAELDRCFRDADAILDEVLAEDPVSAEYELVALGHAPVTPVDRLGLLPRRRYELMDRLMPARGGLSRNMMRATAGFQLTYDVSDRADAGRKLALLNRLSPLLAAWTANSREVAGRDSGYASFRHHVWLETDTDRSGVPPGGLDPDRALDAYRDYALDAHVLFRHGPDGFEEVGGVTLRELAASDRPPTRDDVDLHLTSLFPFVRLRNYVEVRCFDSIPWPEARSIQALVSGIVYCEVATARTEELTAPLVIEDPAELRALHERAARDGLDAVVPGSGEHPTLRDLGRAVLEISAATLGGDGCDWSTPQDLVPIRDRLER
jgi:glutamate--cysteine ligase